MAPPLARGGARERAQRLLRGVVVGGVHVRVDAVQRAHGDDPAPARGAHVRKRGLHRPERAHQADAPAVLEVFLRLVFEALHAAAAPGVVDEDVDAAELRHRALDSADHLLAHADVGRHEQRAHAELRRELQSACAPTPLVDLRDEQVRALAREAPRDPAADPLPRARHDRRAPLESLHHRSFRASPSSPSRSSSSGIRSWPQNGSPFTMNSGTPNTWSECACARHASSCTAPSPARNSR